jgi:hypothetical protein
MPRPRVYEPKEPKAERATFCSHGHCMDRKASYYLCRVKRIVKGMDYVYWIRRCRRCMIRNSIESRKKRTA